MRSDRRHSDHAACPNKATVTSDGNLAGCRMFDGTVLGEAVGSPTTCYFVEPMPSGDYGLTCRQ